MRTLGMLTLAFLAFGLWGCAGEEADPAVYSVIPLPQEMEGPGLERREVPAHWLAHLPPSRPLEESS